MSKQPGNSPGRTHWLDESTDAPLIHDYASRLSSFLEAMADGKIDDSELPETALIRELKEELGIVVPSRCLAPLTFASHTYEKYHLLMPLYACRNWEGEPEPLEGQKLAWVRKDRLRDYPMPAADVPLIPILQDWL